jgi:hypothetical protein
VNIDVDKGQLIISYDYVFIDKENKPKIIAKENVPKKYLFETLNKKNSFEGDNEVYYKDMFQQLSTYRHINHCWILKTLHKHRFKELLSVFSDFLLRQ